MSIPRKGSRTLTHAGHHYRWYVRRKPTYTQGAFKAPMTVAIERVADAPGTILLVDLIVSRPDNWLTPHQTALKPATIRAIIQAALEGDWDPETQGNAHPFEYSLITDEA
ncbi:MAG: hypothetical protein KF915_18545 [Polyangiaceae bacterium]|nr:hypothetical protein [Polyangiaceae bacterium]